MDQELILELPNDIRSIEHAVESVTRHCSTCYAYARRFNVNFRVGLTEALSNAMLYGNGSDPQKRVRVEVDIRVEEVAVRVTDQVWFSIFIAWLIKAVVLRYGGPKLYAKSRPLFLGFILGQFTCSGTWLLIDLLTGMTGNRLFWI